VRFSTKR